MSRWGHGHSIVIGLLLGALLARNLIWVATIAWALGFLLGRSYGALAAFLRRPHRWPVVEGRWRR